MKLKKLYERITANPQNVDFRDLVSVAESFGFRLERVAGSHHIYRHPEVAQKLNIQPRGKMAKPYQVRQFLALVSEYNLKQEDGSS